MQQDNVPGDTRSALQTVIDAGGGRSAVQRQVSELEAALDLDDRGDSQPLLDCVRSMLVARAELGAADAGAWRAGRLMHDESR